MKTVKAPRFMISAASSGSGKTVVTCGLIKALQNEGVKVQSFKCGPDYIDPLFHQKIINIPSYNLDTYFTGKELTKALFMEKVEESPETVISVAEGVMGFFDGIGGKELTGSSSDLARVLNMPVVLVVDAKGMSRSIVALLKGFCSYDANNSIKAVILNKVSGMMFPVLKALIEEELNIKVLGYVPFIKDCEWESRHLGLYLPEEISDINKKIDNLASVISSSVDMKSLIELANSAEDLEKTDASIFVERNAITERKIKIAIAKDEAFCFYYEDNFRLLKKLGAELLFFSPLHDIELPLCDGIIIGGGYPECYCKELENNISMRMSIKNAILSNIPVLAECGGFMYLQKAMTDKEGNSYKMVGALDGNSFFTGKLVRFGYAEFTNGCSKIKGHEFHYFDSTNNGSSYAAQKPSSTKNWKCIVQEYNVTAGFPHLYYYSCPEFAEDFLRKCSNKNNNANAANNSSFFENKECQYYPCHKDIVECNCLFCYCPFYLRNPCPGKPSYIKKDDGRLIKRCTDCTFPHKKENYSRIIQLLKSPSPIIDSKEYHHGGEVTDSLSSIDFSVNINPLGYPDTVKAIFENSSKAVSKYPDQYCNELRKEIAARNPYGISLDKDMIIAGNGASELINLAVCAISPKTALLCVPSFSGYERSLKSSNAKINYYKLKEYNDFALAEDFFFELQKNPDIVFLCNPNNPTGQCISDSILVSIADYCESNDIFLVIDECFLSFVMDAEKRTFMSRINDYSHLLIIDAFTKIFAIPGVRLGYAVSSNIFLLKKMKLLQSEWSVSQIAQLCGIACLKDTDYINMTRQLINKERLYLQKELKELNCKTIKNHANFMLLKLPIPVYDKLLEQNIIVRDCSNFEGLDNNFIRIAILRHEENEKLVLALRKVLNGRL